MRKLLNTLVLSLFLFPNLVLAEKITLKLGASLPLSGRLAYVGKDIQRGLELAIKDYSNDRLAFEVAYEDNQHEGKHAATTAHKLIEQNKVDAIISLWDMADVVAPIAERSKTPHLAIRWNPHIAETHSFTFTMESTYRSYIESLLDLTKALKIKKLGILTEEAKGWVLASEYLQEIAPKKGFSIVGEERVAGKTPDYRSAVLRLLKKNPELTVLLSNPPHTEIMISRIREANPDQKFTGYFEYLKTPSIVEGVPFAAQFAASPWFESKFENYYGESFQARAPQAYDIIKLLSTVQSQSKKKLSSKELVDAISGISDIPGASGTLTVSGVRTIESECVWKIVRNGKVVILDPKNIG